MNRRHLLAGAAAIAATVPMGNFAFAQPSGMEKAKLPPLMGGDFATAISQLAANNANYSMVKAFAELENAEQAAVAEAFGLEPGAAGLSEKHAAMVEKLRAADGAEFDMIYIEGQIDGHEELQSIHKKYAQSGDDPMARGRPSSVFPPSRATSSCLRASATCSGKEPARGEA